MLRSQKKRPVLMACVKTSTGQRSAYDCLALGEDCTALCLICTSQILSSSRSENQRVGDGRNHSQDDWH